MMSFFLNIVFSSLFACIGNPETVQQQSELQIIHELFRLRNEHKADSAERFYADTVLVYMKYLRNIPKSKITQSDKSFWKSHPKNKFEMAKPVQLTTKAGITTAIIYGKEYLDGKDYKKEKIEIRFNRNKKINYYRAFHWK